MEDVDRVLDLVDHLDDNDLKNVMEACEKILKRRALDRVKQLKN